MGVRGNIDTLPPSYQNFPKVLGFEKAALFLGAIIRRMGGG